MKKIKLNKRAGLSVIILILFLSACSPTQQAYHQNFKLYFVSNQNVTLSDDEIITSPVDLIYVKHGERPVVTMALAFVENGLYKWLSSDDAMIITDHGRLVRTVGFNKNLLHVSNAHQDFVKGFPSIQHDASNWRRNIDTEVGDYGAEVNSEIQSIQNTSITIQGIDFSVIEFVEEVTYDSVMFGIQSWSNRFWYHAESKQLLQSKQTTAPNLDALEVSYVSRALRLIDNEGNETL